MIALSYSQPWAELIADGTKTIENRRRPYGFKTPFPNRVLIHRAQSYQNDAPLRIAQICAKLGRELPYTFAPLPGSVIIGVVDFNDALDPKDANRLEHYDRQWVMPEYGWCYVLRNPRRFLEPIPFRGNQNFFQVPDELVAEHITKE